MCKNCILLKVSITYTNTEELTSLFAVLSVFYLRCWVCEMACQIIVRYRDRFEAFSSGQPHWVVSEPVQKGWRLFPFASMYIFPQRDQTFRKQR